MNDIVFRECTKYFKKENGYDKNLTWEKLAVKLGYKSGESLRSEYKRERKKVGPIGAAKCNKSPKIIVFDIETSPMIAYIFSLWDDKVNPGNVVRASNILCWSGKELNSSEVFSDALYPDEAISGDDFRITKSLWNFLNGAHILIGHNIKNFDIKFINTRFLKYGLPPLSSFQIVDTLLVARDKFEFASNKLSFINEQLGIRQKIQTSGMQLWKDCMDGNSVSLMSMRKYCEGDVLATEETYYKFLPFITGHPNYGLYSDGLISVCPNCGHEKLSSNGFYYTTSGKYESMRCDNCGSLSRAKKTQLTPEKSKGLLRN